jgi:protein-disulfide isomerase
MTFRKTALALLMAAPLVLAGCNKSDDTAAATGGAPKGEVVANVPAPAGKMWSDVVVATPEGGMLMGNANAPIKLLEYGSLSCPHCARLANEGMATLRDKYVNSGRVSYEFRSFPIHGVIDVPLTVMAKCAGPETFFPIVEQLYSDQEALMTRAEQGNAQAQAAANLPPAQRLPAIADAFGLTEWFAAHGVSTDQSHGCLANGAAAQAVADQGEKWTQDGVDQTPTLVINGTKISSASWGPDKVRNDPGLEAALQAAGAR